ncbi:unnamed protein product, partial [Ixodes persulcatus]
DCSATPSTAWAAALCLLLVFQVAANLSSTSGRTGREMHNRKHSRPAAKMITLPLIIVSALKGCSSVRASLSAFVHFFSLTKLLSCCSLKSINQPINKPFLSKTNNNKCPPTFQTRMAESAAPVTSKDSSALAVTAHTLSWCSSNVCTHSLAFTFHSFKFPSAPLQPETSNIQINCIPWLRKITFSTEHSWPSNV